jgi:NAD(P)H-hydrate epimerase
MREWEQSAWATGRSEAQVIAQVGRAVARAALRMTRWQDSILVLAGKGNNGADARAALNHLAGRHSDLLCVVDPGAQLASLRQLLGRRPRLIIDGLFGIGLDRALAPEWVTFIEEINHSQIPVLAIDVPSGLNADTGFGYGACVLAQMTLTVGALKHGLLSQAAWPFAGRIVVASDVGLGDCPAQSRVCWSLESDFSGFPPPRRVDEHKGTRGHVAIYAGSPGYHGAAVLAARGAQRAQPGLVTLYALESIYHVVASQLQAVMVSPWQLQVKAAHTRGEAVLVGPGLAAEGISDLIKTFTRLLWRDSEFPLVADASALDWVPLERPRRNAIRVLSPHPGEAARLLRSTAGEVQANRVAAVQKISERYGDAWVVLKGHQTAVGRSTGPVFINSSGNPLMAQGGSGDLLAGYITGLLVQPQLQEDVAKTLAYAVWEHGRAADYLSSLKRNWIVEDLAAEIGAHSVP